MTTAGFTAGGKAMKPSLSRQARKLATAKRLIRAGRTQEEAADKVGWTARWLRKLIAEERADTA